MHHSSVCGQRARRPATAASFLSRRFCASMMSPKLTTILLPTTTFIILLDQGKVLVRKKVTGRYRHLRTVSKFPEVFDDRDYQIQLHSVQLPYART
jgi:hypothetical protein